MPVPSKGKSSAGSQQRPTSSASVPAAAKQSTSVRSATGTTSVKPVTTKSAPVVPKENLMPKPSTTASRAAANASKEGGPSTQIDVNKFEAEIQSLKLTIEEQDAVTSDLRLEVEVIQKERDFYFEKLRDIEVLLQQVEDDGRGDATTAAVFKILYATADGFERVVNSSESEVVTVGEPMTDDVERVAEPIVIEEETY